LAVPLGRLSVSLPDVSVAAVNCPEPIWVATAVGVAPVMVKVTVVGVPPPPPLPPPEPPPEPPEPPALPPQPESKRSTRARAEIRNGVQGMEGFSPGLRFMALGG